MMVDDDDDDDEDPSIVTCYDEKMNVGKKKIMLSYVYLMVLFLSLYAFYLLYSTLLQLVCKSLGLSMSDEFLHDPRLKIFPVYLTMNNANVKSV